MQRSGPKDFGFLTVRAFAHRGLHAPMGPAENSLAAFENAIAEGYGIELDVRLTADKGVVVYHDAVLPGVVNADGEVARLTTAELAAIKLRGGESIFTLREAMAFINGRTPTLIELKSPGRRGHIALCRAVRRAIEGANGWAAVMSFDPRIVRWFCQHSPLSVRGLVITEHGAARTRGIRGWISRRLAIRHGDPHFLAYDVRSLPSPTAERFRASGRPVLAWTVLADEDRTLADAYADAIIFERAADAAA